MGRKTTLMAQELRRFSKDETGKHVDRFCTIKMLMVVLVGLALWLGR